MARVILGLLVAAVALFGESAAWGGRKALAPSPSPAAAIGLPPIPADLGFIPLNSKEPKVIRLANFAVDEYNKAHNAKLVYGAVLEAISTTNEEGLTTYGLFVSTTNGNELATYQIDVVVTDNVEKLTFFAQLQ